MNTCPYCGSEIKNEENYYCHFCVMNVPESNVQIDGERLPIQLEHFAYDALTQKTTPELMCLSTFELIYLLKEIRAQRSNTYQSMATLKKAGNSISDPDIKEGSKLAGEMYETETKQMFIVENIIRDRLGYIPTRITEKYLDDYAHQIEQDRKKKGKMVVRQPS